MSKITSSPLSFFINYLSLEFQLKWLAFRGRRNAAPQITNFSEVSQGPKKILVILPLGLHYVLSLQDILLGIKENYQNGQLFVLGPQNHEDYSQSSPFIDGGFFYQQSQLLLNHPNYKFLKKDIQKSNFDVCFNFFGSVHPLMLDLIYNSGIPVRIGNKSSGTYPFLNFTYKPAAKISNEIEKQLSLLQLLNIKIPRRKSQWEVAAASKIDLYSHFEKMGYKKNEDIIALNAYGLQGREKIPKNKLKDLVREILSAFPGAKILMFIEEKEVNQLKDTLKEYWQFVMPFHFKQLSEIAAAISLSRMLITPYHFLFVLSQMLNKRTLGIVTTEQKKSWIKNSTALTKIIEVQRLSSFKAKMIKEPMEVLCPSSN